MEQNKLLLNSFKQIFHITDTKPNIIEIPIICKIILNKKLQIKDYYKKTQ